ncbi:MAG TPA: pyridoxamine 5'-phosphate oxidase family protein [Acidimicrobiia bacterium]|jgi:nitroimidazol reductase NimA-like FMN-containing flavoprotein (pyridoxamine 5'-phosphate oxidase superfamily)
MDSMNPPTDHRGLEVLTPEECDRLLEETPIGRVAFLHAGEPQILPVNYRYVEGSIVIRTSIGSKMDVAEMQGRFAFEIDDWDTDTETGWSVLAHGIATVVTDEDEVARLSALGLRPWAEEKTGDLWIRLILDDVTGRRIA